MIEDIFNNLHTLIGKNINCIYYLSDKKRLVTGKLKNVTDYKSITIDNTSIPFIGLSFGIKTIFLDDNTVIYNNPYIIDSAKMNTLDEVDIMKKTIFGDNYKEKYSKYHAKTLIVKPKNVK